MGVPKFYRWISERYACLSQVVKEHQIPEFDNLYLDMNGIIHPCSHPNDDDPHFRITEADIFQNIFHYIEVLFRIIRPKKVFYMAVDGVAPRAKMNQQRSRRFRTAKEAEDNIRRAIEKGQVLPKEERFDSNCITPGTEFMTKLHEQLKYFVNMKVSSDPIWQNCTIYLSGHNVPGEGEHKIMDYIRYEKSKEDYDPNTRHCLYGLDADLMILGLTSHEPHFSLLREEVRFGKQAKRLTKPEEQTFHLLHLSLMREYLDFEFGSLKDKLPFQYELERIIDDWVLLGFLVGNDFIPHLPHMHINHDALPYLYEVYIEVMPTLDGYLNEGGSLNLIRFEKYLNLVSKFDRNKFQDIYSDMKWLQGKIYEGPEGNTPKKLKFSEMVSQLDDDEIDRLSNRSQNSNYLALADISDAFDDTFTASPSPQKKPTYRKDDINELLKSAKLEEEDGDTFELEFEQNKRSYYMEKFHLTIVPDEWVRNLAVEYVRAIQWILHYYFNGVQSWSWYYPFHYAPYVSDITDVGIYRLLYEKAKPFKPFEQLLAVLPAASRKLLPHPFQSLMIMDNSPIIDFYPVEFDADLNGKQQDWEAVVLIPFIDEGRLLSAMARQYSHLTDDEKERNSYGTCLKSNYSPSANFKYPSSLPGILKDIDVCRTICEELDRDFFRLEISRIKKGLCEGVKQSVYFPGFPTFKHIPHNADLKKAGVRVFQQNSKNKNMIINVEDVEKLDIMGIKHFVGQIVYVEWPYLVEAFVISVSNKERRFSWNEKEKRIEEMLLNDNKAADCIKWLKHVKTQHLERRGIDLGEVSILVEAKPLVGKRYVCGAKGAITLEKEWTGFGNLYSHKVVIKHLSVYASLYEKVCESVDELFPIGSECFMMASPHYGCSGEVLEIDKEAGRVRVALKVPQEPDLDDIIRRQHELSIHYIPTHLVAQKLGISSSLLARITGNILIQKEKDPNVVVNIGLRLKYSKGNKEVLGFARRTFNGGWSFSPETIDALSSYIQKFPFVFDALSKTDGSDRYKEEDVFPNTENSDVLQEVKDFLKTLPFYNVQAVECGSNTLDKPVLDAIEKAVEGAKSNKQLQKTVKVKVKPYVLFRSTVEFGNLVPDPSADYNLFDRVVNVRDGAAVPLGIRGTVIGIHQVKNEDKEEAPKDWTYEVIFDEAFLGGLKLRVSEEKGYYMTASSLLNLSYGERKEAVKKGRSPASFSTTPSRTPLQSTGNNYKTPPFHGANSYRNSPSKSGDPFRGANSYRNSSNKSADQSPRGRPSKSSTPLNSGRGKAVSASPTLISPDFWLESYGGGYAEQQQQHQKTPMSDDTRFNTLAHMESNTVTMPTKDGGNTEFLAMWKELQKSEQLQQQQFGGVQHFSPRKGEITNVTSPGIINKLFNMNPTLSPPEAFAVPQHLSQRPHFTPVSLNQIFQQQPRSPPQTSHFQPASPTSPSVLGMPPSSALLQNWCVTNKMPMPNYTYSVTSQGVHAVVTIGPAICFGGMMCSNRQQAAESAAAIAFSQLPQFGAQPQLPPFGAIPVQVPRHQSPSQQTTSPTYKRQPYATQQQQKRNSQPSYSGQRCTAPNTADQTGIAKPATMKVAKNLFIPHQVEVKSSNLRSNNEEGSQKTGTTSVDKEEAAKKLSGTADLFSDFEVASNSENKLHDSVGKVSHNPLIHDSIHIEGQLKSTCDNVQNVEEKTKQNKNDTGAKKGSNKRQILLAPTFFGSKN